MIRGHLLLSGLVLVLLAGGSVCAEEDAAVDLKERAKRYKQDEREHQAAIEKAEAERAQELAAAGIVSVATVGPQGDSSRSVDVVFLGDGFTADEMKEYEAVIERMAKNFDTPPFDAHRARLNLHRVNLVSAETGLTRDGKTVSTRLGGTVVPFPGGKLLRCDTQEAARLARLAVPDADYLMVVLNTHGKFLGSANSGAIVLLSTAGGHQRSIVVHEFAHNFGGLYDEYVDPKQAQGRPPPPRLRQGKNVGLEPNVHAAKWHYWNIPEKVFRGVQRGTSFKVEDNVRCYEGGATFPDDVYRPEESCHMQRGRGKAFCRACTEGLELSLCRFFDPIESVTPAVQSVTLTPRDERAFEIRPASVIGAGDEAVVRWYVDGRRVKKKGVKVVAPAKGDPGGARYVFEAKGSSLGEGRHHLTATIELQTPRVRMDLGRLAASYTWTIDVGSEPAMPELPEKIGGDVGVPVQFTAKRTSSGDDAWVMRHAPEGASFDPDTGAVEWTPDETQQGAWAFTFAREDGNSPLRSVPARIRPAKKRPNRPPKPVFIPPQEGVVGERLTVTLTAWDPDGDHLAWSAEDLPSGAALDPNAGALTWDVGSSQGGSHELAFTCTDGRKRMSMTVRVEVEGVAPFRGIFKTAPPQQARFEDWADLQLLGLHHPQPRVRLANAKALNDAPATARLAEALRLLREQHAGLHAWAMETLEGLFDDPAEAPPLDMLLDALPAHVWQYVDRPKDRAFLDSIFDKALAIDGLAKDDRRALEALKADLEAIETYGKERLAKEPIPPITDKKYR